MIYIYYLLSTILLSTMFYLPFSIYYLLSTIYCLLSTVYYLLSTDYTMISESTHTRRHIKSKVRRQRYISVLRGARGARSPSTKSPLGGCPRGDAAELHRRVLPAQRPHRAARRLRARGLRGGRGF